ncbi:MAG: BREX-1 system adenine-specific DNA-methyltransferase [Methanobrevibacter sp. CfCl-M3]
MKFFKDGKKLSEIADVNEGVKTANNDYFIRNWFEIEINKTNIFETNEHTKLFMHTKGGTYRKWYGNNEVLLNYENNGLELKNFKKASVTGESNFFLENISWTRITSSKTGFRYTPKGSIPNMAGLALYPKEKFYYIIAYLNSKIVEDIIQIINPTLNFPPGVISKIPVIFDTNSNDLLAEKANENINLSKEDWDNFEESWNFTLHPLMKYKNDSLEKSFIKWDEIAKNRFYKVKINEEKINEIFIDIYNLKNSLSHRIEDKDITLSKADLGRDIKSFLSYFIGCLFGRYSLDEEGLIFAGGDWNPSKYTKFIPDEDNIVPILDTEYFYDDIVKSFEGFLKIVYGAETLEDNIKFIADALGNKGKTYRDTIRRYFLKDFFNDHKKMYKKTPIYWLFDSGKEDGFKALIYMHRYTHDSVARIRTDYLHRLQKALETKISNNEQIIQNSTNQKEKNQADKDNIKIKKQLEETRKYDESLAHIANQQIDLDLDDGVKVNYSKFQNVEVSNKKMNLLKDIIIYKHIIKI